MVIQAKLMEVLCIGSERKVLLSNGGKGKQLEVYHAGIT